MKILHPKIQLNCLKIWKMEQKKEAHK